MQWNGNAEEICGRMVVGADGRSSVVSRSAGFQTKRHPDRLLLAGVLLEDCPAAEDTGKIVLDSQNGCGAVLFPQGGGRVRAYFGYHHNSRARIQGDSAFPDFIESCKRTGADPGWYDGAKSAGPLASFDGADTDTPHPYRDGVALIGDAAATSDPNWGQGLSTTLRDARILRDKLLANDDWNAAGHAYAEEHDQYCKSVHDVVGWYTDFFLETGPEADARRARAFPLIAQDPDGSRICCSRDLTCRLMKEHAEDSSERTECCLNTVSAHAAQISHRGSANRRSRQPRDRQNGDVVFLSEGLRGIGDVSSRLCTDVARTIKAIKLAGWAHRFDDTIGEQRQRIAWLKMNLRLRVFDADEHSQGKSRFNRNLLSPAIRREMPGIRGENASVRANADAKAGNKSAVLGVAHLVAEAGQQRGLDRDLRRRACELRRSRGRRSWLL